MKKCQLNRTLPKSRRNRNSGYQRMAWPDTALTRRLGIRYPIIQAPMAGDPGTPQLVAAASNAGGLGSLAGGYM